MIADAAYGAVDLCAGPGGWDVAAQRLGLEVLGFEIDDAAILTRDAAGHATAVVACEPSKDHPRGIRGLSMTEVDPADYAAAGLIASPPCQGFSMAGKGRARQDAARLIAALDDVVSYDDLVALIADARTWMAHEGTVLVLEPLRWALRTLPAWLAWEQVPAVLPLWEACARVLRRFGYSVATGNLQAEQYGVPQTRKRAILVGRSSALAAALGPVALPVPTHSRYHQRTPGKIDAGLPRWVSMAEALGMGMTQRPSVTVPATSAAGGPRALDGGSGARRVIREAQEAGDWVEREVPLGFGLVQRPSYTVPAGGSARPTNGQEWGSSAVRAAMLEAASSGDPDRWIPRENAAGESIVDGSDRVWETRPATTIVSSFRPDVVAGPGYRKPGDGPRQNAPGSIRVTVEEAAALQSFPVGYPWQGSKTKQFQQVGNAIPPLLAEAVLCAVLGLRYCPPAAVEEAPEEDQPSLF